MHQLLYITCADEAEALKLAEALLDARLIACANLLPPVTSCFRWNGAMQQNREVVLLAKTTAARFEQVEALVKAQHSYDCPCLVAFDIARGHAPFLQWLSDETEAEHDNT